MKKIILGVILLMILFLSFSIISNKQSKKLPSLPVMRELPLAPVVRNESIEFPSDYTISTWVWKSPDELSSQEIEDLFSYASKERINTIYVDIGKYADINDEKDAVIKQEKKTNFDNALKLFILKAQQKNILVDALGGGILWSNSSHQYIPPLLLDYVLGFNKANPEFQLVGIQYDIEFYSQKEYELNKAKYNSNFLNLTKELVETVRLHNSTSEKEFKLGLAIPFWLDSQAGGYVFNTLADTLNKGSGSYFVIMAYRNSQSGSDGVFSLVKNEMDYVEKNTSNVSVLIAQETESQESAKTTFYGKSKQDLKQAVNLIIDYFKGHRVFSGIAIHHFYSYEQLKDF